MKEMVMQNVCQHHFPEACGGRWTLWDKLAHRGSGIAALYEFDENDRFFTTFCDPYMGHTCRLFSTHHHIKGIKDGF
jgi:hypothetical protein